MTNENDLTVFEVTSGFGANTQEPYVQILIHGGDFMTQMSPENARELAINLITAAEAADSDGFIMDFLKERVGIESIKDRASVLIEFRHYRETQRVEEEKRRRQLYPKHTSASSEI